MGTAVTHHERPLSHSLEAAPVTEVQTIPMEIADTSLLSGAGLKKIVINIP